MNCWIYGPGARLLWAGLGIAPSSFNLKTLKSICASRNVCCDCKLRHCLKLTASFLALAQPCCAGWPQGIRCNTTGKAAVFAARPWTWKNVDESLGELLAGSKICQHQPGAFCCGVASGPCVLHSLQHRHNPTCKQNLCKKQAYLLREKKKQAAAWPEPLLNGAWNEARSAPNADCCLQGSGVVRSSEQTGTGRHYPAQLFHHTANSAAQTLLAIAFRSRWGLSAVWALLCSLQQLLPMAAGKAGQEGSAQHQAFIPPSPLCPAGPGCAHPASHGRFPLGAGAAWAWAWSALDSAGQCCMAWALRGQAAAPRHGLPVPPWWDIWVASCCMWGMFEPTLLVAPECFFGGDCM